MKRLLILEDSPVETEVLSRLLSFCDLTFERTRKDIMQHDQAEFDLVVLDVLVPDFDGTWDFVEDWSRTIIHTSVDRGHPLVPKEAAYVAQKGPQCLALLGLVNELLGDCDGSQ